MREYWKIEPLKSGGTHSFQFLMQQNVPGLAVPQGKTDAHSEMCQDLFLFFWLLPSLSMNCIHFWREMFEKQHMPRSGSSPSCLFILDPFLNGPDGGRARQMFPQTLGVFVCLRVCLCLCALVWECETKRIGEENGFNLKGKAESGEFIEERQCCVQLSLQIQMTSRYSNQVMGRSMQLPKWIIELSELKPLRVLCVIFKVNLWLGKLIENANASFY